MWRAGLFAIGWVVATWVVSPLVCAAESCCEVVLSKALADPQKGRLVVTFPGNDALRNRKQVVVRNEPKTRTTMRPEAGSFSAELWPGTYEVQISGWLIKGVPIKAGQDTKLKVGTLRLSAGPTSGLRMQDA
jgi:hypothetical protein